MVRKALAQAEGLGAQTNLLLFADKTTLSLAGSALRTIRRLALEELFGLRPAFQTRSQDY